MSLNIKTHLPDTADVLMQSSKSNYVPHRYVAISGHSSMPKDWEIGSGRPMAIAPNRSIRRMSFTNSIRRDVVSFGKSNASSAEAMVLRPARIFAGTRCFMFPKIEPPRELYIYYYEGNDAEDNTEFAKKVQKAYGQSEAASLARFLGEQYASVPRLTCHLHLADTLVRIARFAFSTMSPACLLDRR